MKQKASKIFWGILLLLTAAALVLYGIGESKGVFGMPMHKMLFAIVLSAWIISKVLFSDSLRERLKIFFPLGLLFMVLETEIAKWAGLPSEEIINNWIVLLASILADIAITVLVPRGKSKGKHFNFSFEGESDHRGFGEPESYDKNRFSESTVYIDASKTKKSFVENKLGETNVYYQNAENIDPSIPLELTIVNHMGETNIHVPADWYIVNEMSCALGAVNTRKNIASDNQVRLIVRGDNKMGETNIGK